MPISKQMIEEAINKINDQEEYHFVLFSEEESFVQIAISTFAKNYFGEILACMPTSLLRKEMLPRGYIVTSLFIYSSEVKPIFIDDIKKVEYAKGMIVIYYHHGGIRRVEGGTFDHKVYQLLTKLISPPIDLNQMSNRDILSYCILTYEDDGGYEFELAYQPIRKKAASLFNIHENQIVGYMDTSLRGDFKQGFIISEERIDSNFFIKHHQLPIDLNDIHSLEYRQNRLVITHLDQSKSVHYVSIYGEDLKNLIELYLKNKH